MADTPTQATGPGAASPHITVSRFHLTRVLEKDHSGASWYSSTDRCAIGSHDSNDLLIEDPTVSRFHCEIVIDGAHARIRDLSSRNGTFVDGVQVFDAFLKDGSVIRVGRSTLRFQTGTEVNNVLVSSSNAFGVLVGQSVAMRAAFAMLESSAESNATVLLEGETGTGKDGAAASIHQASGRRDGPFVVVDCGAIPHTLLESELFGHERGAFTGANARRIGAFEEAAGGTIFLDELGEIPLDLQPKLLRVLEQRAIRRVGGNAVQKVDVRVIAATNRDLRAEVNAGRFRSDLFFRLAVIRIRLPPLRARPEDVPLIAARLLDALGADAEDVRELCTPQFIGTLQRAAWPGNVRELRNYLERCLVFRKPVPLHDAPGESEAQSLRYDVARRQALDAFERAFVERLLALADGKVLRAAELAGIDRAYIYRMMRRHNIRG